MQSFMNPTLRPKAVICCVVTLGLGEVGETAGAVVLGQKGSVG